MPYKKQRKTRRKRGSFFSWKKIFLPKQKRLPRFWKKFTAVAAILLIVAIFVVLFFTPLLKIKSIHIKRQDILIDSTKIQKTLSSYLNQHLLSVSTDEIRHTVMTSFPEISEVEVIRKWPDQLHIKVVSHPPTANIKAFVPGQITSSGAGLITPTSKLIEQKAILNSQGYVIDINKENPQFPTIVFKERKKPLKLHEKLIEPSYLKPLLHSLNIIEEYFEINIKYIEYFRDGREYHVTLHNDTTLWLDYTDSPENQLNKLKKAITDLNFIETPVEYIDLRIKDKLIYKP